MVQNFGHMRYICIFEVGLMQIQETMKHYTVHAM